MTKNKTQNTKVQNIGIFGYDHNGALAKPYNTFQTQNDTIIGDPKQGVSLRDLDKLSDILQQTTHNRVYLHAHGNIKNKNHIIQLRDHASRHTSKVLEQLSILNHNKPLTVILESCYAGSAVQDIQTLPAGSILLTNGPRNSVHYSSESIMLSSDVTDLQSIADPKILQTMIEQGVSLGVKLDKEAIQSYSEERKKHNESDKYAQQLDFETYTLAIPVNILLEDNRIDEYIAIRTELIRNRLYELHQDGLLPEYISLPSKDIKIDFSDPNLKKTIQQKTLMYLAVRGDKELIEYIKNNDIGKLPRDVQSTLYSIMMMTQCQDKDLVYAYYVSLLNKKQYRSLQSFADSKIKSLLQNSLNIRNIIKHCYLSDDTYQTILYSLIQKNSYHSMPEIAYLVKHVEGNTEQLNDILENAHFRKQTNLVALLLLRGADHTVIDISEQEKKDLIQNYQQYLFDTFDQSILPNHRFMMDRREYDKQALETMKKSPCVHALIHSGSATKILDIAEIYCNSPDKWKLIETNSVLFRSIVVGDITFNQIKNYKADALEAIMSSNAITQVIKGNNATFDEVHKIYQTDPDKFDFIFNDSDINNISNNKINLQQWSQVPLESLKILEDHFGATKSLITNDYLTFDQIKNCKADALEAIISSQKITQAIKDDKITFDEVVKIYTHDAELLDVVEHKSAQPKERFRKWLDLHLSKTEKKATQVQDKPSTVMSFADKEKIRRSRINLPSHLR